MMPNFQILSDSSCDIPDVLLQEYKIELVPFYVSFDQENYQKERVELTIQDFYHTLRSQDVFPKTSLPSVQDYINAFTPYLEKDIDILCFCLTSKFSGSYQAAVNAKNILIEEFADAHIEIINSIQATAGQGLVVLEASRMQQAGFSLEETVEKIEILKETSRIMFTVHTLEYLQKGGRIGKAGALVGTILNVKPLLYLSDGELHPYGVVRGRKKAFKKIIEMAKEELKDSLDSYQFCIAQGDCIQDAENLKQLIQEELGVTVHWPFFEIGATIGTNTGPDALGICFIKKFETLS